MTLTNGVSIILDENSNTSFGIETKLQRIVSHNMLQHVEGAITSSSSIHRKRYIRCKQTALITIGRSIWESAA